MFSDPYIIKLVILNTLSETSKTLNFLSDTLITLNTFKVTKYQEPRVV